ncbi:sensor histidine kinase [Phenylobacterium sp.]|uniref:sensor histidine kinase PhyK n=1 Tax=Phenylobacterium sp. TaxID=1871053 RepID=UPI0037CB442D
MTDTPPYQLTTIRLRLTAALAAALLPVLALGAFQATIDFQNAGRELRQNLTFSAERSAAVARARMESADILLRTLAPGAVGFQCAQRLGEVIERIPGYRNLIRFDRQGRVVCSASTAPADPDRASRDWFRQLAAGRSLAITRDPGPTYASEPAVLAAARATAPDGAFDGAVVAVIALSSLQPRMNDPSLPRGAEVGLAEKTGRYITVTNSRAFPQLPLDWRAQVTDRGSLVWFGEDSSGQPRVYSAAPLVGDEVYVVLSAPSPGVWSWARLNPLTSIALPLLTFLFALIAVSLAADRVVVRWIVYLQRIATLYARGRFSVRPVQAEQMPPEIRELAETLEDMADAIVIRDASLREALAQKDDLMREIHHRVKNNLQVISSLLSLQQRALSDPAAKLAMGDMRQRIGALALIYRALYQGPDLKRVDLQVFLEELTAQLVSADAVAGRLVSTEIQVQQLIIEPDRLAPLALFAVEAINNAQKHAFDRRGGVLRVALTIRGDEAELSIADDGAAADESLVAPGVGRTLMIAFARQLNGQAVFVRNAAGGVTASLAFPTSTPNRRRPPGAAQAAA